MSPRRASTRVLALALAVFAGGVLAYWLRLLAVPHAVEKVEVQVLSLVLWWRSGVVPYLPLDRLPFLQNPYGPLFEALCAALPTGPSPYFAGRLLSILAFAATLALVGWQVERRTGRRSLAVIAALLPLTVKPVLLFAPLYRVDSLGLFLSVAGFLLVTADTRSAASGRRNLALGVTVLLLAFLTKMTFVAAPLAAVLVLWGRDRRRAVALALAVGLAFGGAVAALELATGGAYLASAASGNLPTAFGKSLELPARMLLALPWLVALALCAAERTRRLASPAAIYAAVALAVAAAFAANPLSSWNYLMETTVALALWTGEALGPGPEPGRSSASPGPSRRVRAWLFAHVGASAVLAVVWLHGWETRLDAYRPGFEASRAAIAERAGPGVRLARVSELDRDALNAVGALSLVAAPEVLARQWRAWE